MNAGKPISKQYNAAVDIFRYVSALLVVAIHTHPFMDIHPTLGFVFTHMITRIGVPFFFGIGGYYFACKLDAGKKALAPYLKHLLLVYSLWTVFYYVLDFAQYGCHDLALYIKTCVTGFVLIGSRGHFWFFPALIYAACFVTLLWQAGLKKVMIPFGVVLYGIGCLGSAYHTFGVKIPLLSALYSWEHWETTRRIVCIGFPFFGCGYLVKRLQSTIRTPKMATLLWGISALLWLGEIVLIKTMNWCWDVATTPFLYLFLVTTLLFLLTHPANRLAKQGAACRVMANFTYYSHPFVILCIRFLFESITETPVFLVTSALCGILGFFIYKWNNKYLNYLV